MKQNNNDSVSVLIGGDVVPVKRTVVPFRHKAVDILFGDVLSAIKEVDYSLVNFESPILIEKVKPIEKSGPSLFAERSTLDSIKDAGFKAITLANNHFRDYGQIGVENTLNYANSIGVDTVGGGRNQSEATRQLKIEIKGKSICFVNVCESEFSIAINDNGGSNPLDVIQTSNEIIESKNVYDYVIVIVHGGIEHYQYPTPRMVRTYRHFIKCGADAVINHHQHCMCGYEIFCNRPIFYGIGNLNFDSLSSVVMPKWTHGYMVKLYLGNDICFDLIPYIQNGKDIGVKARNMSEFLEEIAELNNVIMDNAILEQKFDEYLLHNKNRLLMDFFPFENKWIKGIYRRGLLGIGLSRNKQLAILNKIRCESHRESITRLLSII